MIDWISATVPFRHLTPINDGWHQHITRHGEMRFSFTKMAKIEGSHSSSIMVRTGDGTYDDGSFRSLEISGNPVKFFQGHNLFGIDDLRTLMYYTLDRLSVPADDFVPAVTEEDRIAWRQGNYSLSRVDVTYMYDLGTLEDVLMFLRAIQSNAAVTHRKRGEVKGHTVMFGKGSRRSSYKLYAKGVEILDRGHELPDLLYKDRLIEWTKPKLRSEATYRGMELQRLNVRMAAEWNDDTPSMLHEMWRQKMDVYKNLQLTTDITVKMTPKELWVYNKWINREPLTIARTQFFHWRKVFREKYSIDLSGDPPKVEQKRAFPVMEVLIARPVGVPDWARGTPLYFDPRKVA